MSVTRPRAATPPSWYDELREQYRPTRLHVLLIGESPPDPGDCERRFFYALAREDNLYRGVAKALYEHAHIEIDVHEKPEVLARLRADGFWLIDAVAEPINRKTRSQRRRQIRAELGVVPRHVVDGQLSG